jgi:signal transduction histidine kinase
MDSLFLRAYQGLYHFVAKDRIAKKDLPERYIHTHLVCVLATGILMWAYTLVAYFTISDPAPAIVGLVASIIHALSPLLYRLNKNRFLNSNIFIGAGIVHQSTFGYFCGGFQSNIIVWFGILPLLAGLICGRRGIVTWLTIGTFVLIGFLLLEVMGVHAPDLISPTGLLISQALVTFGWIFTSAVVIWFFLISVETHQKEIEKKKEGIQNLICVITHDISTPISVIIGRSNMLKKFELPEEASVSINKIIGATTNMTTIVNNVRNLYAMELGKSAIPIECINLNRLMPMLQENFAEKLEAKNIKFIVNNEVGELEIKANADLLLHQILGNLLSNAIKFSPEGSEIHITMRLKDKNAIILITDSGIGIPTDLIPRLFEMHSATSRTGTSGEKGTGFGLPIVKAYVEKLDGKISVFSKTLEDTGSKHGTTFELEFLT